MSLSLQIIASASTAYSIPWPPSFNSLLSTLRIFLVDVVSITRTNCAQPMTYYGSLMTLLIGEEQGALPLRSCMLLRRKSRTSCGVVVNGKVVLPCHDCEWRVHR